VPQKEKTMFEGTEQVAEGTVADEAIENDDDFNAGFDNKPTAAADNVPTETPAQEQVAAPEYVQITKSDWESLNSRAAKVDQIEATLGKRFDQAFGKMGGLERKLAEMQAAAPEGQVAQISDEDFAEMAEDYPELAAMTVNGLNKVLGKMKAGGGSTITEEVVTERMRAVESRIRAEVSEVSLETAFPGWKKEVRTPRFDAWLNSQADDVKVLAESPQYGDAAQMLRLYSESLKAPAPTPSPKNPAASSRQRQIAAAVPPRGDGGRPSISSSSEDDEFNSGFTYRSGHK
jgi:hypothetical protein